MEAIKNKTGKIVDKIVKSFHSCYYVLIIFYKINIKWIINVPKYSTRVNVYSMIVNIQNNFFSINKYIYKAIYVL